MLDKMDCRSDRFSARLDGSRLSSSLPPQRWSHLPPSFSSPAVEPAVSSHQNSSRHCQPPLAESCLAHRTTALRQLNGNPKPLSRKHRQAIPSGSRSSTLASQPVLVRTYSGNAEETAESSKMPSRRPFPFSSRSGTQQGGPELPSDEEFSIEGILRAIEPDIRGTLDSIAEICGRSKLSLANEYGSHIAPLGEIRAPPGGLLTVEEASPSLERQPDESVVIFDDDNSLADGRDHHPFSYYGYMENIMQATAAAHNVGFQPMIPFSAGDGSSVQVQPATPRSIMVPNPAFDHDPEFRSLPVTREFTSKPKSGGRDLLGKRAESAADDHLQGIVTPAVVSEVYLDAQADGASLLLESRADGQRTPYPDDIQLGTVAVASDNAGNSFAPSSRSDKLSTLDVRGLLNWFKGATQDRRTSGSHLPQQSAEMRLRAMLEQNEPNLALRTA